MSYFVARSMFFLVTCSFGSECCRLRNSATALAGNSVSQTYPKSLARCTASPEKGGTGGDGRETHSSSVHIAQRQKSIRKKKGKALHSTWSFLLKGLDFFFEKGRVRNANPILSCRSLLLSRAMQMCIFTTIVTKEISHQNFFKFALTNRYF